MLLLLLLLLKLLYLIYNYCCAPLCAVGLPAAAGARFFHFYCCGSHQGVPPQIVVYNNKIQALANCSPNFTNIMVSAPVWQKTYIFQMNFTNLTLRPSAARLRDKHQLESAGSRRREGRQPEKIHDVPHPGRKEMVLGGGREAPRDHNSFLPKDAEAPPRPWNLSLAGGPVVWAGDKGNVSQTTEEKIPWEGEFTIRSDP